MVAGMTSAQLDDEARVALVRAARMAGVPELGPVLLELAATYVRDRTPPGPAPTGAAAAERLGEGARLVRKLQRALRSMTRWERGELAPAGEEALDGLALCLPIAEACMTRAARDLAQRGRRRLDRAPGTPRWALLWGLAAAWSEAGGHVGWGASAQFAGLVDDIFTALGDHCPDRLVADVAKAWRGRPGDASGPEIRDASSAAASGAGMVAQVGPAEPRRARSTPASTRPTSTAA
jgi:hypothetical protein